LRARGAEHDRFGGAAVGRDAQLELGAGVEVPGLGGVEHAVPVRALARADEEVDRGRRFVAEGLAVVAAFGVRLQLQARDELVGGHGVVFLNRITFGSPALPIRKSSRPSGSKSPETIVCGTATSGEKYMTGGRKPPSWALRSRCTRFAWSSTTASERWS